MRYLVCIFLLVVLMVAGVALAQDGAPVQVEVRTADRAYSYDCWPAGDRRFIMPDSQDGVEMMVWLSYPSGVAGYRCLLAGQAVILPMPAPGAKLVARDVEHNTTTRIASSLDRNVRHLLRYSKRPGANPIPLTHP